MWILIRVIAGCNCKLLGLMCGWPSSYIKDMHPVRGNIFMSKWFAFESSFHFKLMLEFVQISFRRREKEGS